MSWARLALLHFGLDLETLHALAQYVLGLHIDHCSERALALYSYEGNCLLRVPQHQDHNAPFIGPSREPKEKPDGNIMLTTMVDYLVHRVT